MCCPVLHAPRLDYLGEVFAIDRNGCSAYPKRAFAFGRNPCSASTEIPVRLTPKSAFAFPRNTHMAVWEYVERTCEWIFGDSLGDPLADDIRAALRRSGPMTRICWEWAGGWSRPGANPRFAMRSPPLWSAPPRSSLSNAGTKR